MADCLRYWTSAELVPTDLRIQLHHENICLGLYADNVLPGKRSGLNYENHLKFVRFLVILPVEGAVFTRRADLIGPAYRLIRSALKHGYLEAEMDVSVGWSAPVSDFGLLPLGSCWTTGSEFLHGDYI